MPLIKEYVGKMGDMAVTLLHADGKQIEMAVSITMIIIAPAGFLMIAGTGLVIFLDFLKNSINLIISVSIASLSRRELSIIVTRDLSIGGVISGNNRT